MRDGRIDRLVAICGLERGGGHAVEESDKPIDGCCPSVRHGGELGGTGQVTLRLSCGCWIAFVGGATTPRLL